jgi:hypothetical protein
MSCMYSSFTFLKRIMESGVVGMLFQILSMYSHHCAYGRVYCIVVSSSILVQSKASYMSIEALSNPFRYPR